MAYDKIITIRTRLDDCLRYVQDGEKTALSLALDYIEDSGKTALDDEVILQSAINCTVENCYLDMQRTKERFGKPGGVVGYQSEDGTARHKEHGSLTEHIEEWIYAALRYDCLDFSIA